MSYFEKVKASPAVKNERGWNVQSSEMRVLLGLGPKDKLPFNGMLPRKIQGVTVWVEPAAPKMVRNKLTNEMVRVKSSKHRVMAECPRCKRGMSAGRLHQHICKEK